jgi:hypothetical protein
MKKIFTSMIAVAIGITAFAQQLPNSGFETWSDPKNPDNWATWESSIGSPLGLATKDTATKVEGLASIKIKTDSIQAGPTKRLIPGFVLYGTTVYAPPAPLQLLEKPFAGKPDSLFFSFRYTPGSIVDSALLEISASGPTGTLLGAGTSLPGTNGNWIAVAVDLTPYYLTSGSADSLSLLFSSSNGLGVAGSVLNVDAIRFGYKPASVGINYLAEKINLSVYPNPASHLLTVTSEQTESDIYFEMNDVNGRIVLAQSIKNGSHTFNVSQLENGNYFYRISADGIVVKSNNLSIVK